MWCMAGMVIQHCRRISRQISVFYFYFLRGRPSKSLSFQDYLSKVKGTLSHKALLPSLCGSHTMDTLTAEQVIPSLKWATWTSDWGNPDFLGLSWPRDDPLKPSQRSLASSLVSCSVIQQTYLLSCVPGTLQEQGLKQWIKETTHLT